MQKKLNSKTSLKNNMPSLIHPSMLLMMLVCICISGPVRAQEEGAALPIDRPAVLMLQEYSHALKTRKWKIFVEGTALTAYRYHGDYREVNVSASRIDEGELAVYEVNINVNGAAAVREFRIRKDELGADERKLARLALPFLMAAEESTGKAAGKKVYFSKISAGYTRFSDDAVFYPEYREGSFSFAFDLVYDPSKGIKEKHIPLGTGDYFSLSVYAAFDNEIRENHYNINLLIYGAQEYSKSWGSGIRFLHGVFTGLEYFRPSGGYTKVTWDEPIYSDHPHIQYIIYRAVSWGYILNWGGDDRYTFSFIAGLGPSINSSINATRISPEEEKDLSFIFKSKEYGDRRQNFYYGIALPLAVSFSADRIFGMKFEAGYNFYYFAPIEDEKAYDILNVLKISPGYYLSENVLAKIGYEFWHINSLLEKSTKLHFWNRIIIAIEYTM